MSTQTTSGASGSSQRGSTVPACSTGPPPRWTRTVCMVRREVDSPGLLPPESRLGRRQPGDRHPVRRAADVVEPHRLEEVDRRGIAAVLTADAELDVGARLPALFDGNLHELSD